MVAIASPRAEPHGAWSTQSRVPSGVVLALATVLLLAACGTMLLVSARAAHAAPTIFPVCIDAGGQAGPDMGGNVAVWTDNRNGNLDIYGGNVKKKSTFAVCVNKAEQSNPAVCRLTTGEGKLAYMAVWVDKRKRAGTSISIYARNLTTRAKEFPVTTNTNANAKWYPRIAGQWVVWVQENPNGGYWIRAKNLATGDSRAIASSDVLSPLGVSERVAGSETVYTAVYSSSDGDISGRDLPDGTPFTVSQSDAFEWSPDISGNRVVWWENGGKVMLKNLKTGKRTLVAKGARPRVDGELVTWDGGGKGGSFTTSYKDGAAIYVRNVTNGTRVIKITQPHMTCLFPVVSGETVVWESGPAQRILGHIHICGARL
jgi:beta propeller repeat protein